MLKKPSINTVIVDLDNTLFDWVEIWQTNFLPKLRLLSTTTGIEQSELLASIKLIHQLAGTSEYAFLIEHMLPNHDINHDPFGFSRNDQITLYPTVLETLKKLKNSGVQIIAYTESMELYSSLRLKRFGLDGIISSLYCPKTHNIPDQLYKYMPAPNLLLQNTLIRHTAPGSKKPSADSLNKILSDYSLDRAKTAYVGDSLDKDMTMARECRILDVYAKYGVCHDRPEYTILRNISHWPQQDTDREIKIDRDGTSFTPTITLDNSLSQIFDHIEFSSHH